MTPKKYRDEYYMVQWDIESGTPRTEGDTAGMPMPDEMSDKK